MIATFSTDAAGIIKHLYIKKAMFPADAARITRHVFPTAAVGIQVKYCSVLRMFPLLQWENMEIQYTNPAAKCQKTKFRSATDTVGLSVPQEQGSGAAAAATRRLSMLPPTLLTGAQWGRHEQRL